MEVQIKGGARASRVEPSFAKGRGGSPSLWFCVFFVFVFFLLISFNGPQLDQLFLGVPFVLLFLYVFFVSGIRAFISSNRLLVRLATFCILYLFLSSLLISFWPWFSLWVSVSLVLLPLGMLFSFSARKLAPSDLVYAFLWVVFINSVLVILLALSGARRPSGFVMDPNLAANFTSLAFLSTIYLSQQARKLWLPLVQLVLGISLFLTVSRGAIYSLGGAIVLLYFLCFVKSSLWYKQALISIVVLGLAFFITHAIQADAQGVTGLSIQARPESWNDRVDMWGSAWRMYVQEPLLGTGLGTFALRYPLFRSATELTSAGYYAHNDYLQLLLELGVVGFVVWFSLPVLLTIMVLIRYVRASCEKEVGFYSFVLSIVALVAVHSSVNFVLYHPLITLFIGLILGMVVRRSGAATEAMSVGSRYLGENTNLGRFIALCIAFSISVTMIADQYARVLIPRADDEPGQLDLQSPIYYKLLPLSYLSPLNAEIKAKLVEAQANTAIDLYPSTVGSELTKEILAQTERYSWLKRGACSFEVDAARAVWFEDPNRAIQRLERELYKAPSCIRARITLGDAYVSMGDYQKAITVLNEGVNRFPFRENGGDGALVLLETLVDAYRKAGEDANAATVKLYLDDYVSQRDLNRHGYPARFIDF